jgi:hypothetical protein
MWSRFWNSKPIKVIYCTWEKWARSRRLWKILIPSQGFLLIWNYKSRLIQTINFINSSTGSSAVEWKLANKIISALSGIILKTPRLDSHHLISPLKATRLDSTQLMNTNERQCISHGWFNSFSHHNAPSRLFDMHKTLLLHTISEKHTSWD